MSFDDRDVGRFAVVDEPPPIRSPQEVGYEVRLVPGCTLDANTPLAVLSADQVMPKGKSRIVMDAIHGDSGLQL